MYKPRASRGPLLRRSRVKFLALCVLGICSVVFIIQKIIRGSSGPPPGTPQAVLITVLDPGTHSKRYLDNIRENREQYARKHGYTAFFPTANDYNLNGAPKSWAKLPAMRHALTKFPHSEYFWYLDQNALIMNPGIAIEEHIMSPKKMDTLMIKDQPIVPPDSVIKTFGHLRGDQIHFALTQDKDGLSSSSFIVRNGDWARFLIDTWFDPLYRSYNFQKAETHALEHVVQWHPTILSRLAIVPQRILNAYSRGDTGAKTQVYKDGDFIINFAGCDGPEGHKCETEAEPFLMQWRTIFNAQR